MQAGQRAKSCEHEGLENTQNAVQRHGDEQLLRELDLGFHLTTQKSTSSYQQASALLAYCPQSSFLEVFHNSGININISSSSSSSSGSRSDSNSNSTSTSTSTGDSGNSNSIGHKQQQQQ